jgi:hypothetical protein
VNCQHLEKAAWFSSLDTFKGFWQFPLAEESQEVYSFLTELGVFTLKRLIQGSTDSAHAFQASMMVVFEDTLYICVLIWIDDVMVDTRSFEDLLTRLEEVFQRFRKFNVKLNLQKTDLCTKEITWCGRKISVKGIKFDPEMIESLLSLPEPENAANLQKFLCGANWIRSSIPEYAMEVAPLQELMRELMRSTGSAKSSKLRMKHCSLSDSCSSKGWIQSVSLHGCFGFPLGRHCDTDAERRLGLGCLGAETRTSGISQWNFQKISEALECD